MRVRILGKYWKWIVAPLGRVRFEGHKVDGLTDATDRTVHIDSRLRGKSELEAIIHEFEHACDQCNDSRVAFIHSEGYVTAKANDLSRLLWRMGYRRSGEDNSQTDAGVEHL